MRRFLIATEGSIVSNDAVREFARIFGAGIGTLYVLAVIPPAGKPEGHPAAADHYHRAAEDAQEALDLAIADLQTAGHDAIGLMRVGPIAETIVEVAQELNADLLVLGTHDRRGLGRLLHGSVAEQVLREAPCAVFIFPHGVQQRADAIADARAIEI